VAGSSGERGGVRVVARAGPLTAADCAGLPPGRQASAGVDRTAVILIEDVAQLLRWLVAATVGINLLFLWVVVERRLRLQRYFVLKDSAREDARAQVAAFARGELSVDDMVRLRKDVKSAPAREAVHELLFAVQTPGNATRISELLFALHSVDVWAVRAFGRRRARVLIERAIRREAPEPVAPRPPGLVGRLRRLKLLAVPRALAVDQLGRLAPEFAQVFLVEAAADPAREVRQAAVGAMGRARYPPLIPHLMYELERAIEQANDVSWQAIKIALTSFRLPDLPRFVPFLDHPHPRMRFTVVDIVRHIAGEAAREGRLNKNDFSPDLYGAFVDRLVVDPSPDVRARAASVVRHFRDQRAVRALRRLVNDDNEFVRLHAVRAAGDRFYADLLPDLTRALLDASWRVRDAAVRTLLAFGTSGLNELYRVFLESEDEGTARQITDGLQRAGAMPTLLASLTADHLHSSVASAVCQKMALLGQTVYLNRALASIEEPGVRIGLMDALMRAPDAEYITVLESLARHDTGKVGSRASDILRQSGISSVQGRAPDA
jgi:HEAT repeat protein